MSKNIVFEGWLTKSPPSKRIWRTKWRRRWFALRQSGELPGQYFLDYYSDRHCRRLKGSIDLDCCDQVDAGLHMERDGNGSLNRKLRGCVFTIQTNIRTYHLEADSEEEMGQWVDTICRVCGLKASDSSNSSSGIYQNTTLNDVENNGARALNDSNIARDARKKSHIVTFKNSKTREKVKIKTHSNPNEGSNPNIPTQHSYTAQPGTGPYIPISECITGVRLQDTQTAFTFDPKNILLTTETEVRVTKSYTINVIQPKIVVNQPIGSDDSESSEQECRSLDTTISIGDSSVSCAQSFKRLSVQDGSNSNGPPVPPRPPKTFAKTRESSHLRECQGAKFQEAVDVHEASSPFLWVRLPRRMSQGAPSSPIRSVINVRPDDEDDIVSGNSMHYCNISSIPPAVDRALKPRHSIHSLGTMNTGQKPQCSKTSDEIKPEKLQYLDLDLPEPSSSFKSQDGLLPIVHGKSASDECAYKTVDFVKTEAFNSTRQDAEASRSVQQ